MRLVDATRRLGSEGRGSGMNSNMALV